MQESNAACAHLNVLYSPIKHDNGTFSDLWKCRDCEHPFAPVIRPSEPSAPLNRAQRPDQLEAALDEYTNAYVEWLHSDKSPARLDDMRRCGTTPICKPK